MREVHWEILKDLYICFIMCRNFIHKKIKHKKTTNHAEEICNIMEKTQKMLKSYYGYLVLWYETKGCSQIPRLHFNFFSTTFLKLNFKILWISNIPNILKIYLHAFFYISVQVWFLIATEMNSILNGFSFPFSY